nr:hypothetical protein [uncultured Acetatifactor sp.]
MITAVLEHRGDTLVTELPCGLYELQAELSSIGITWQSSSLPVSGTEAVHVELAADGPVGEMVLSHMGCTDLFLDLNRVCQEIERVCPFGHDGFLDMLPPKDDPAHDHYLLYRKYEQAPPSTATGLKYLEEEAGRYRATMESYKRAWLTEMEEEEPGGTDDSWKYEEEWER